MDQNTTSSSTTGLADSLEHLGRRIADFDRQCARDKHTVTVAAWGLFGSLRSELRALAEVARQPVTIRILVEGGLVQEVRASRPASYVVADRDVYDGGDLDEVRETHAAVARFNALPYQAA